MSIATSISLVAANFVYQSYLIDKFKMDDIVKKVKSLVQSGQKRDMLLLSLALDSLFVFSVTICSLVVMGTANVGFNIVLTSLLNIGYIVGANYVISNSKTPIAVSCHTLQFFWFCPKCTTSELISYEN